MTEKEIIAGMQAGSPMPIVGESQCVARGHPFVPSVPFVPFFSDPARVTALMQAIEETRGTPWAQFGRVMGKEGGSDCVYFPEYVLGKAGVGQGRCPSGSDFSFQRTAADYQTARSYLRLLHMLRGQDPDPQSQALAEIFAEIPLPSSTLNLPPSLFMPGDLAVLRDGGMFHLPVITRGRKFVHCMKPLGVTTGNMHDTTFSNHLVALFRARDLNTSQVTGHSSLS